MPVKKAAAKALRRSVKQHTRNIRAVHTIKKLVKVTQKNASQDDAKKAIKAIDKAMQKGIMKKNTGARKKSRLLKSIKK